MNRSAANVKAKIDHIISTYKDATEQVHQSGNELDEVEYESFMDMIHRRYCKYYSVLEPVLSARPNIWPKFTNEDSCSDKDEGNAYNNSILLSGDDSDAEETSTSTSKSSSAPALDISDITSKLGNTDSATSISLTGSP